MSESTQRTSGENFPKFMYEFEYELDNGEKKNYFYSSLSKFYMEQKLNNVESVFEGLKKSVEKTNSRPAGSIPTSSLSPNGEKVKRLTMKVYPVVDEVIQTLHENFA
jgi:hypothetical protein